MLLRYLGFVGKGHPHKVYIVIFPPPPVWLWRLEHASYDAPHNSGARPRNQGVLQPPLPPQVSPGNGYYANANCRQLLLKSDNDNC